MPNAARHLKSHRLNRIGDQIGSHVIIESDQEDLVRAVTKRKTAANPGAIGSLDLQNIGEDHFVADLLKRFFTQLNGHTLGCEASVDIRASRLRRAAIPYVCITRLIRFFPVRSSAANVRWSMVSSFSCAASMRTASSLSALGRLHCTYRLLRAMPNTRASGLLLIGLRGARTACAPPPFCAA